MANFFTKIFGTHSSHELKKIYPIADKVEALEEQFRKLSDEELRAKTDEFKKRYQDGETLDQLLPEAFATCREASWRVLGMRHYRVQIIGGIVLHQGRIAEMKTGEGKTLMATLPAYLNALTGKGVHIVTVNDYLAKRDSEWMGKVYRFLGLNVGLVIHEVPPQARKAMYAADITYGTNNEFGFDYLRDNMAIYKQAMVQRGHAFAIVDEVDSILIDEARTPLIISGQGEKSSQMYEIADRFAVGLKCLRVKEVDAKEEQDDIEADYIVDEKAKTATLTPHGQKRAEAYFKVENLSDPENTTLQHYINQAIKARGVMKRDVDYVVRDGEVVMGSHGFAGEIGHLSVAMDGPLCSCGRHGCLEAFAGRRALVEAAGIAEDGDATSSEAIDMFLQRWRAGDSDVAKVVDQAADALVSAIASAVNLVDVDTVLLGGLWTHFGDELATVLEGRLRSEILGYPNVKIRVFVPPVALHPSLYGAAEMGLRRFIENPLGYMGEK